MWRVLKIKGITLVLMYLCTLPSVTAQEPPVLHEVGLSLSDFNNIGVTYRRGTEKALWRFNIFNFEGEDFYFNEDRLEDYRGELQFNIGVGREYRRELGKKLTLRYGADLSFSYYHRIFRIEFLEDNEEYSTNFHEYYPHLSLVVGFNYSLSSKIAVGVEVLPNVGYEVRNYSGKRDQEITFDTTTSNLDYRLSNSSALLSIVYKL
jgi:hypothetical protein